MPSSVSARYLRSIGLPVFLLACLALGAVLLLHATSGARQTAASTTLRIWYGTDDPTEAPVMQALANRFQAAHPGVTVRLSTYTLEDINTKLQLALASGNAPDLIYTTPRGPGLPAYVRAGDLLDLAAVARKDNWAGRLRPGLLASYNDLLSPTGRAGGHVYGAPYMMAIVGVLYNKTIFSQLHLAIPTSLAAFEADCARAKAAGLIPIGLGNADGWVGDDRYLTLVNAMTGPASLVPEQRLDPHFRFSGAAFLQAGALLQHWATAQYFTPEFGGLDSQDGMNAFFQGKTAMALISSTENGQIVSLAHQHQDPRWRLCLSQRGRSQGAGDAAVWLLRLGSAEGKPPAGAGRGVHHHHALGAHGAGAAGAWTAAGTAVERYCYSRHTTIPALVSARPGHGHARRVPRWGAGAEPQRHHGSQRATTIAAD